MPDQESPRAARKKKNKPQVRLENAQQTYDCALNLLSYRDHSQHQLRQKLLRKGASEEDVQSSLDKLTEYGIMDEERFAQRVYEAWLHKRVYGRLHLVAELYKQGVPQEYHQGVLEQFTDALEQEHAQLALEQFCRQQEKKITQAMAGADPKEKQKIYAAAARFLSARGFGGAYMELVRDRLQARED